MRTTGREGPIEPDRGSSPDQPGAAEVLKPALGALEGVEQPVGTVAMRDHRGLGAFDAERALNEHTALRIDTEHVAINRDIPADRDRISLGSDQGVGLRVPARQSPEGKGAAPRSGGDAGAPGPVAADARRELGVGSGGYPVDADAYQRHAGDASAAVR